MHSSVSGEADDVHGDRLRNGKVTIPMVFLRSTCLRDAAKAARRSVLQFSLVLCVLIFSTGRLHAQNAAMSGLITDPSGAVVQHAQVILTNERTHAIWKIASDNNGLYSVPHVPPGTYTMDVDAPGFKHYEQTGITINSAQALALDAHLQVGGASQSVTVNGSSEYAGGQVARGGRVGLLGNQDIMDVPFNITSYTSEMAENQQARNIGDVLSNNSSVRSIYPDGSFLNAFYIRGFQVFNQDVSLDGLYGLLPAQMISPDYAERIELIEGATGLLNGIAPNGSVGGSINVVPKRATDQPFTNVTVDYGSSTQFGTHLDSGRRFGANSAFGARFNGTFRGGDTAVDNQFQQLGAAVLGLDYRSKHLRASLDGGYQNQLYKSFNDAIYPESGFDIPSAPDSSKNFMPSWSYSHPKDIFGVLHMEYDINPNWVIYGAVGGKNNSTTQLQNTTILTDAAGDLLILPYLFPYRAKIGTGQAGASGTFHTGPINHHVAVSGTLYHEEDGEGEYYQSFLPSNLYNPTYIANPGYAPIPKTTYLITKEPSIAIADTASVLHDRLQLTLGAREQNVNQDRFDQTTGAVSTHYDKSVLTPAFAFLVRPIQKISFYGSYIEGLQPGSTAPSTAKNANQVFPPYQSKQYEVGAKVDFGRFGATIDFFQIKQPNGITDPNTLIYDVKGQQRNRGIELNTFGKVSNNIRLLGGITAMNGIQTDTGDPTTQGKNAIGVPRVLLNIGAEWDTPFIPRLTLTGRAIYTSRQFVDAADTQPIPDWERFDPGVRYSLKTSKDKLITFRAEVLNVANKSYWSAASPADGLARSTPRTFRLSSTFSF